MALVELARGMTASGLPVGSWTSSGTVPLLLDRLASGLDGQAARFFLGLSRSYPWLAEMGSTVDIALHPWVFRVVVAGGIALSWAAGRPRAATAAASAMVIGGFLGLGLKRLIARPRAVWDNPVFVAPDYSMPSGHALNAALGAGLLLMLAWPWLRRRARAWAVIGAVSLVLVVCLDRMLLGVHYLSDVTVGAGLGTLVAAGTAWLVRARGWDEPSLRWQRDDRPEHEQPDRRLPR